VCETYLKEKINSFVFSIVGGLEGKDIVNQFKTTGDKDKMRISKRKARSRGKNRTDHRSWLFLQLV
jgi:hypothetical protein